MEQVFTRRLKKKKNKESCTILIDQINIVLEAAGYDLRFTFPTFARVVYVIVTM